ncbi:unnamed protein product [Prorocentrum cordatum]|uniref:Integrase catalytic domain-containing protein n=1 Tax=Prorocentrum cordatum TaxID=2364126 RepID=A0ABN9SUD7_9DINO|nr:unnamed protein product [Polarella glacialis]
MATGGAAAASGEDKSNGGKIPVPVFDGTSKTMKKYRREVATWQIGTEVKPPKQGATLLASLKGKAEEACEELDLDAIKGEDSVEVFLEYLGKRFPEIEVLGTPALLETFVRPACVRHKYEEIRDYNNRFNGIATKLKAKGIQVPDEVLVDPYIKGARLPPERAASVPNGVGNQFNPTKIQEQLMINLPKVSVVDGSKDSHDKGGYGGHKNKDHKRAYATETYEEDRRAELDGASSDSSDDYEDELPDELQDVIDEAEEQVAFFTKKMVRAKDKLKEAKQARGYFAKRDGGNPPKRDDPKIAKMKARTHCGACGQKGHWRGDPQCSKKNDPNAKADIPKKGSNRTNIATHETSDAQEPHVAERTVAAVHQQDQRAAARDRKYGALHSIDWTQIRQAAELPEEVTAAAFFINKDHQCLMAATSSALIYLSVEDLLKESGGKLTFDTACTRCVGDLDWYSDIKKRLAAFNIQPIEYPEKEPFRFGASKVVFSLKAALIPCSVNGKAFTVRMSIARSAVPGLFSRKAQSELDIVYHAGDNKLDIKSIDEHNVQMGLSRAGHPTLDITGFTPDYKPVLDVSDTKAEIRFHPCVSYHAETAVASAAKPVVPEARHPGVTSEADESPSDTDCNALDSAELFEQQLNLAAILSHGMFDFSSKQAVASHEISHQHAVVKLHHHRSHPARVQRWLHQRVRRVPWQIQPPQLFTNQRPALMPPSHQRCTTSPKETSPGGSGQNLPTTSTARLPAISSMRMPELQAEVASYDLDVRDATCDQLRVILRALRAEGRESTPQDDYIPGLGKKNKEELQQLRRDRQIEFDQRTPVPELRQRLKGWKVEDAVSSAAATVAHPSSQITGADKMRFGKYPTADYRWVLKNDLGHAQWAVLELKNNRASPLLARFARWVKAHGVQPLPPEKAKTTLEAVMAEEVVLDDEWPHEMDTSDMGFEKAGETDKDGSPAPRRRSGIKKGKRVGLLYQVTGLLSAFAFQTVLTADWPARPLKPVVQHATSAARDVVDHVQDVKEAYSVRSHRVDVMQVFGGEGGITEAAWKRRMTATEVIDRKYGWDLRKQKDLDATYDLHSASRPKFVSIELPCTHYTNITHLKFRTPQARQALRRIWRTERPFLLLARDLFKYQLDSGDMAMIENPATSRLWTQRAILEILADERAHQVRLLVTHKEFEQLKRTCSHKHHDQTFGDNVAVRKSGVYPAKFCRAAVRIVGQAIRQQGGHRAYQVDCQSHSSPFIVTVPREQATAYVNDTAPLGETGEPDGDPDPMGGGDDFADTHDVRSEDTVDGRIGVGAITFTKKAAACCKPAELAMLKRRHVNLGHPSNEDLGRSLRLKGAESATVQAVKGLICGDVDGKSYWYFSIVDLATTFHVATLIDRHTSQEFAAAFERCWASWAGVPDRVHFDMEKGFGGALSELFQSFNTVQLPIAGQAHWQLGRVERQGAWWKELAARTIEHSSIRGEDEMRTLAIMVSGAKNSLRRRAGFSPAQWVLGRDPKMPGDLVDDTANYSAHSLAANDEKIRRRYAIRTAARESFMRMQNDDQLRRAMLARARTVATPLSVGEMCYVFRQAKKKEQREQHNRNAKKGIWRGPCVVIGHQGENTWVSLGGHTMLVAPEHIKALAPDDVWFPNGRGKIGQAVAELNQARDSLEQEEAQVVDIRPAPGEPEVKPDEMEQAWREFIDNPDDSDLKLNVSEDPPQQEQIQVRPADVPQQAEEERTYGPDEFRRRRATFDGGDSGDFGPAFKRLQTEREHAGGSGRTRSRRSPPTFEAGSKTSIANLLTERSKRKQADKEIHWRAIKDSDRELFREAAAKQWSEWQKYGSCQVLSIEESEAIRGMIKPSLILPSRFVYRDKNAPLRTDKHPLPVKAKARLCVGGHMDPRLAQGDLRTDAPTVTRNSTMLFFTICQRFDLEIYAADVEAAFMQGEEQPDQQLHVAQPREGLPGLNPKQLIKILKGVFGLATAPRQWWAKLKRTLLAVEEKLSDNCVFRLHQHSLDPALYYGYDQHGELCAVVVAHVDDLLLGISHKYPGLYDRLHKFLPWGDWRGLPSTFCGRQAWRDQEEALHLRQTEHANTIEEIPLSKERKTDLSSDATPAEFSDNRSALGALGWLSSQTRPDLAAGVATGQRTQNKPTIQDLLETNRLIKLARKHADVGLEFPKLRGPLCLVTYHDASWANADEPAEGAISKLLAKTAGATSKDKKIKIRSQAGYVSFLAVTDCASLYDTMHKDGYSKLPSERRLLLDLVGLKKSLEEEVSNEFIANDQRSQLPLFWVPTDQQLGDQFTKRSDGSAIRAALRDTRLALQHQEPTDQAREHEAHLTSAGSLFKQMRGGRLTSHISDAVPFAAADVTSAPGEGAASGEEEQAEGPAAEEGLPAAHWDGWSDGWSETSVAVPPEGGGGCDFLVWRDAEEFADDVRVGCEVIEEAFEDTVLRLATACAGMLRRAGPAQRRKGPGVTQQGKGLRGKRAPSWQHRTSVASTAAPSALAFGGDSASD